MTWRQLRSCTVSISACALLVSASGILPQTRMRLNMPKYNSIILMRGTPLSGKTTFAKSLVEHSKGTLKRISKDDLRYMFDNDNRFGNEQADFYTDLRNDLIDKCLQARYNVIVDETFVQLEDMVIINRLFGDRANIAIVEMTLHPLDVLIERDIEREKSGRNRIGTEELSDYIRILEEQPLTDSWRRAICYV